MGDYYAASYKHVSRSIFNAVSDRIKSGKELDGDMSSIMVHYNGTQSFGDLTIEGCAGYSSAYKKALQIFNEEYCK